MHTEKCSVPVVFNMGQALCREVEAGLRKGFPSDYRPSADTKIPENLP
jgi:hypothetical protein